MLDEKDTMFLPGFQWLNKGRKLHSINEEKSLEKMNLAGIMNLPLIFSAVLSRNLILKSLKRSGMRNRIYSDELSFWSFLAQIFLYRCSCKEMVKKIQAEFQVLGRKIPGASDSSYCRARSRLSQKGLEAIFGNLSARLDKNKSSQERTIKAIDGTGISMPDTPENQKKYPQNGAMKKGCGFPSMKLAMIFSIQNGALLGYSIGNKKSSERRLALDIFKHVNKGDLLLGDRGFFSYLNFALLMSKGADLLFRYNKIKHFSKGNSNQISYLEKYASDDGLVLWKKPSSNPSQMISDKEWKVLPEELTIRLTKIKLQAKGFRTQEITLACSLLDWDFCGDFNLKKHFPSVTFVRTHFPV